MTKELEGEFRMLGGHAIKHLLLIHPDRELIKETCKSVLGDDFQLEAGQHETIVMWRCVEDELPEEHEDVLVYYYANRNSKYFPDVRFMKESCFYNNEFECEDEVTHWAKLPKPPNT